MITFSTKARTTSYRFTTTDINCEAIQALKESAKAKNEIFRSLRDAQIRNGKEVKLEQFCRVRVRPRGSRKLSNGRVNYYDTPIENATHYDVYLNVSTRPTREAIKKMKEEFAKLTKVKELYGYESDVFKEALKEYRKK